MTLRISGKNIDMGEALRTQIQQKLTSLLEKYVGSSFNGHVTVHKEGADFRSDCILHLSTGVTLEAVGQDQDAYKSCEKMAERIEKRLRRHKSRLKQHHNGMSLQEFSQKEFSHKELLQQDVSQNNKSEKLPEFSLTVMEAPEDEATDDHDYHPVVIAETREKLANMSVKDAVLHLDLTGKPVLVFNHASNGRINVVYRRSDGTIGWVDPN